jgi:hypothetical protein
MKEVKLLDRIQALSQLYIIYILTTIEKYDLENELASDYCYLRLLQLDTNTSLKLLLF